MSVRSKIEKEFQNYIKDISKKCEKILYEEIDKLVYNAYSPNTYIRTNQLRNNIKTEIIDNMLYVYIDDENMYYKSAVTGEDVTELVPYFINYGHHDSTGINNMYHNYNGRYFIESAIKRIKNELGIDAEIIY